MAIIPSDTSTWFMTYLKLYRAAIYKTINKKCDMDLLLCTCRWQRDMLRFHCFCCSWQHDNYEFFIVVLSRQERSRILDEVIPVNDAVLAHNLLSFLDSYWLIVINGGLWLVDQNTGVCLHLSFMGKMICKALKLCCWFILIIPFRVLW